MIGKLLRSRQARRLGVKPGRSKRRQAQPTRPSQPIDYQQRELAWREELEKAKRDGRVMPPPVRYDGIMQPEREA